MSISNLQDAIWEGGGYSGSKHRTTEPNGKALHVVRNDLDFNCLGFDPALGELFGTLNAVIDGPLDVPLKALAKVFEHCRAPAEHDVLKERNQTSLLMPFGQTNLVESSTGINGAALDSFVDDLGKRGEEVTAEDLRVEEDLGSKESLVTNINGVGLLGDRFDALVVFEPLVRLSVILLVLLHDVGADIAEGFLSKVIRINAEFINSICNKMKHFNKKKAVWYLDALGHLEGLGGRDLLVTLTE